MDSPSRRRNSQTVTCTDTIHWLCRRKSRSHFDREFSTEKSTSRNGLPVENRCRQASDWGFSPDPERPQLSVHRHTELTKRARSGSARSREQAAPGVPAGYHSPVCSKTGAAIDRIAAAIDQLASDSRNVTGEASEKELTARIAALWQMVSDLDPELARRARKYTGLVDGEPSA